MDAKGKRVKCSGYYRYRCDNNATKERQTWSGDWSPVCERCGKRLYDLGIVVRDIDSSKNSSETSDKEI